jgi:hypothetical protein
MKRTIVALAVLSLVIGFVMWQRRRRAPVKQPEITINPGPAPEPPVEPMDSETYELVEAGIPHELINQYVAAKKRGWWDRSKYDLATGATLGALGWASWRWLEPWLDQAEKRHYRKLHQMRAEQELLQWKLPRQRKC